MKLRLLVHPYGPTECVGGHCFHQVERPLPERWKDDKGESWKCCFCGIRHILYPEGEHGTCIREGAEW